MTCRAAGCRGSARSRHRRRDRHIGSRRRRASRPRRGAAARRPVSVSVHEARGVRVAPPDDEHAAFDAVRLGAAEEPLREPQHRPLSDCEHAAGAVALEQGAHDLRLGAVLHDEPAAPRAVAAAPAASMDGERRRPAVSSADSPPYAGGLAAHSEDHAAIVSRPKPWSAASESCSRARKSSAIIRLLQTMSSMISLARTWFVSRRGSGRAELEIFEGTLDRGLLPSAGQGGRSVADVRTAYRSVRTSERALSDARRRARPRRAEAPDGRGSSQR